jgi:hypothetical protein
MKTQRLNVIQVGLFFIGATVFGVIAGLIENPILTAPDYQQKIVTDPSTITTGVFLISLMAICYAGVGMGLYPQLRESSQGEI